MLLLCLGLLSVSHEGTPIHVSLCLVMDVLDTLLTL